MNRTLKLGALLAIVTIFGAIPATADSGQTLDYTLSGGPVSASWTMSQDPTPFYVEDGAVFAVNSTDLIVGTPLTTSSASSIPATGASSTASPISPISSAPSSIPVPTIPPPC